MENIGIRNLIDTDIFPIYRSTGKAGRLLGANVAGIAAHVRAHLTQQQNRGLKQN